MSAFLDRYHTAHWRTWRGDTMDAFESRRLLIAHYSCGPPATRRRSSAGVHLLYNAGSRTVTLSRGFDPRAPFKSRHTCHSHSMSRRLYVALAIAASGDNRIRRT